MSKNLDETVRLQSEKRQERIREIRERDFKGLQRAQVVPPFGQLINRVVPQRRIECPGTHCSLIEQEEREDSSC